MPSSANYTCMLCDAHCGLAVQTEGGRVTQIRGNEDDPFSRGHLCGKASIIGDLMEDPDRVRQPLRREGDRFVPVPWADAIDAISERLAEIRRVHGPDAIATYLGNPTAHDHGAGLGSVVLRTILGGRNHFSAASVDNLPRMVTSVELYGVPTATPVPDIDHTDLWILLGANPIVSNGSGMVSPDIRRRMSAIQARGGRIVVLDPRRTETAKKADEFHFVRPGTDALVVFAMVEHLLSTGRDADSVVLQRFAHQGLGPLRAAASAFPAERVESITGVPAADLRRLADELATTKRASLYGRMGTCVQAHGTTTTLLIDLVNILAGNLDQEGGARFGTPALDLQRLASFLPKDQHLAAARSRVDGLPSFLGEYPVAALLPELEQPGPGQIKAMVVHAGNPVSSSPNGARLGQAMEGLDLVVAIDMYINETTRHADFILPTPVGFERSGYPLFFGQQGVRDFAFFDAALTEPPPDVRGSWPILVDLAAGVAARGGWMGRMKAWAVRAVGRFGADRIVDLLLWLGPHKVRLAGLRAEGQTTDLGALKPRLQRILSWKKKRLELSCALLIDQLPALNALCDGDPAELVLISRRTSRSNNSWLHNMARLTKGRGRCTLEMHPDDAAARGLEDGVLATLSSDVGAIEVPVEVTDRLMPGVVCLPHGWGQDRDGVVLGIARAQGGASINDVIDHRRVDAISGTSALSGQRVRVSAIASLLLFVAIASGCSPPPPAPVGLDNATSYLVREFYSSDARFQAGLQGYMAWFEDEGYLLAGTRATAENTDAFTVGDLSEDDIRLLPVTSGRNIEDAAGVVSLAEMECDVTETEDLLVRGDQNQVFSGDWTDYDRTFVTPRDTWQSATRAGAFDTVNDDLSPHGGGDDLGDYPSTFLQTANRANPEPTLGGMADLDTYDLFLDFRHGTFEVGDEQLQAFAILSYQIEALANVSGEGNLYQTYALELDVERPGGLTLRLMAVWSEVDGAGLSSDSAITLNFAVNKSLDSAERISSICAGDIDIEGER
jgi:anaerobic selenocysteine-containing dehydrogenase